MVFSELAAATLIAVCGLKNSYRIILKGERNIRRRIRRPAKMIQGYETFPRFFIRRVFRAGLGIAMRWEGRAKNAAQIAADARMRARAASNTVRTRAEDVRTRAQDGAVAVRERAAEVRQRAEDVRTRAQDSAAAIRERAAEVRQRAEDVRTRAQDSAAAIRERAAEVRQRAEDVRTRAQDSAAAMRERAAEVRQRAEDVRTRAQDTAVAVKERAQEIRSRAHDGALAARNSAEKVRKAAGNVRERAVAAKERVVDLKNQVQRSLAPSETTRAVKEGQTHTQNGEKRSLHSNTLVPPDTAEESSYRLVRTRFPAKQDRVKQ